MQGRFYAAFFLLPNIYNIDISCALPRAGLAGFLCAGKQYINYKSSIVRTKAIHFARDKPDEDLTEHFQRFLDYTTVKSRQKRRVYVLTNYGSTYEQDLYRINTLRAMGFDPYVMIYERPTAPHLSPDICSAG